MRALAARDGRACAQAHPDDHGGDSPVGRRWGVGIAARVDGWSWRAGELPAPVPFSLRRFARGRRGLLGVERAVSRCAGEAVQSARTNACSCSCIVTYDHARRARKARARSPSPITAYLVCVLPMKAPVPDEPNVRPGPDGPFKRHFHAARRAPATSSWPRFSSARVSRRSRRATADQPAPH
jgi:hypothetical protein